MDQGEGFMVGFKAWVSDKESAALERLITWPGAQV